MNRRNFLLTASALHAPSTPETRHFLCHRRIELLPAGAIIVNTARGDLIKDANLVDALKTTAAGMSSTENRTGILVSQPS
jgi:hypothetical protein